MIQGLGADSRGAGSGSAGLRPPLPGHHVRQPRRGPVRQAIRSLRPREHGPRRRRGAGRRHRRARAWACDGRSSPSSSRATPPVRRWCWPHRPPPPAVAAASCSPSGPSFPRTRGMRAFAAENLAGRSAPARRGGSGRRSTPCRRCSSRRRSTPSSPRCGHPHHGRRHAPRAPERSPPTLVLVGSQDILSRRSPTERRSRRADPRGAELAIIGAGANGFMIEAAGPFNQVAGGAGESSWSGSSRPQASALTSVAPS